MLGNDVGGGTSLPTNAPMDFASLKLHPIRNTTPRSQEFRSKRDKITDLYHSRAQSGYNAIEFLH